MTKVYVIIEYGGMYEDAWEHIIGVCSTPELADELKAKVEETHNKECKITEDEWCSINEEIYRWEEDHSEFDSIYDAVHFLFPEYEDQDIQDAIDKYDSYDDYSGVRIQEVSYFTNLSDLK